MVSHIDGLVKLGGIIYIHGMGRKQINHEQMPSRFPAGTFERMDANLEDGEKRADLIREAVERELKRRERKTVA